jgi:hypothetical protein
MAVHRQQHVAYLVGYDEPQQPVYSCTYFTESSPIRAQKM